MLALRNLALKRGPMERFLPPELTSRGARTRLKHTPIVPVWPSSPSAATDFFGGLEYHCINCSKHRI
jgi:hypothetical protein